MASNVSLPITVTGSLVQFSVILLLCPRGKATDFRELELLRLRKGPGHRLGTGGALISILLPIVQQPQAVL